MTRAFIAGKGVFTLTGLVLLLLAQSAVLGQSVVVNGVPLTLMRKPVVIAGNILLPMRDVFEALQAKIKWLPGQHTITAVRGQTKIDLQIGVPVARINGRRIKLQAAPRLIGDNTYIPLRFPAEAFGGTVEWRAAKRVAVITIPPLPGEATAAAPPAAPSAQPSQTTQSRPQAPSAALPPVAEATRIEGTLLQVIPMPSSIVISLTGSGAAQAVALSPNTGVYRQAQGQRARAAQLAEAMPGEYAVAMVGPDGTALSIDFSYGEVEGTVAGISQNNILLKDNTVYTVSPTVAVLDQASRPIALWDVQPNVPVKLRYQPNSRTVFEVRLTTAPQPPTPTKPSIMLIGLSNQRRLFRAGDVLKVQLQGTPGGVATATLAEIFRDLPLREVAAGVYEGEFTVRGNTNERDLPLMGSLAVNGVQAKAATTSTGITIDTTPPAITGVTPSDGRSVSSADVVIEAGFEAGGGSRINPAAAVLSLNGARVRGATVTADRIGYQAQDLPEGEIRAEVSIEDMAGNRATRSWIFTVSPAGRPLFSVGHDALDSLTVGNILNVSMRARKPGGVATFDLDGLQTGLPMPRVGTSDAYRGQYVVQPGDSLTDGAVTVRYRDPDGVETSVNLASHVTIDTAVPTTLAIKAPASGGRAPETLVVRGEAPPRAHVRVSIAYTGLTSVGGQLWLGVVTANALGRWETRGVSTAVGPLGKADKYLIKAEQLNVSNQVVATRETKLVR
ncbi:MAG: copper amine oxidase N-terminal domain-containing protein [Bacteroidota bacterium]